MECIQCWQLPNYTSDWEQLFHAIEIFLIYLKRKKLFCCGNGSFCYPKTAKVTATKKRAAFDLSFFNWKKNAAPVAANVFAYLSVPDIETLSF